MGEGVEGTATGGVPVARRCTPAVDAEVGADAERDSGAELDELLSGVAALRALSAISSGADCDGSMIAFSIAGMTGATLGAVRRGELMSARPLGICGVSRRDGFVVSTIEPAMVLLLEAAVSSLALPEDEPSGRA